MRAPLQAARTAEEGDGGGGEGGSGEGGGEGGREGSGGNEGGGGKGGGGEGGEGGSDDDAATMQRRCGEGGRERAAVMGARGRGWRLEWRQGRW